MPTYEYRCEKCGKFDFTQKMTEPALETCPTCGSKVTRLISSNLGIVFKGTGWYCVDSRRSSVGAAASSKPSGDSTDSKPAEAKAS